MFKEKLVDFFRSFKYILEPDFYHMNYPYDEEWDRLINEAIDQGHTLQIKKPEDYLWGSPCQARMKVGDKNCLIWVSNYPYAYGYDLSIPEQARCRPSRLTIEKLRTYIDDFLIY